MNVRHAYFGWLMFVTLLCCAAPANAHYLWVTVKANEGEQGAAQIFFEEGPFAGPGEYLDRFVQGSKTWVRSANAIEPREIKTNDIKENGKRWLAAELNHAAPLSVECYGKFGVYQYGKTNVLLHYYAKTLNVTAHEDLHDLARADHLQLDIVPHDDGKKMELQVLWKGEATGKLTVKIRGPEKFQENLQTDETGRVSFEPKAAGRYRFQTMVELKQAGSDGGEAYELIRHHATVNMDLPLKK